MSRLRFFFEHLVSRSYLGFFFTSHQVKCGQCCTFLKYFRAHTLDILWVVQKKRVAIKTIKSKLKCYIPFVNGGTQKWLCDYSWIHAAKKVTHPQHSLLSHVVFGFKSNESNEFLQTRTTVRTIYSTETNFLFSICFPLPLTCSLVLKETHRCLSCTACVSPQRNPPREMFCQ